MAILQVLINAGLHIVYEFNLGGKFIFHPGFSVPAKRFIKNFPVKETLDSPFYRNLLFHIGMIELISYWKTACSPEIIDQKP
jgi:UDP-N-acetyl-alpha-D-muramoyl-L-alanyl-L-glutamate epimerase